MSNYNIYGDPVSMSDLNKPKEGRLKKAYREAKSSIGRSLRRRFGKESTEDRFKSRAKEAREAGHSKPRWNSTQSSTQSGGKRKRRKTQIKPRKTRRTKRRTRKSRR
jgi:hypothetical protein